MSRRRRTNKIILGVGGGLLLLILVIALVPSGSSNPGVEATATTPVGGQPSVGAEPAGDAEAEPTEDVESKFEQRAQRRERQQARRTQKSSESGPIAAFYAEIKKTDLASLVVDVQETEPGRLDIQTSIVDPRGDDGSVEAKQAIAICEAGVRALRSGGSEDASVRVYEADGTHFVLFGLPLAEPGECTEF